MQRREYQQKAIAFLAKSKRGIVQAPAGAGKTHIAASALAVCLYKRKGVANVEIMVNTIEQVDQMQTACDRFEIINEKANLQIYCLAGAPLGTYPDLLIVDECHRAAAPTWAYKIKQCQSAIWGLSATPFSADKERNAYVRQLFDGNVHVINRNELVDGGHLAKAKVVWHDVANDYASDAIDNYSKQLIKSRRKKMPWMFRTDDSSQKQINQCKWQAAQKLGIWENENRDAHIALIAKQNIDLGNHTIVLIGSIDHGKRLANAIPRSELVYSKMGVKKRRDVIARFRNGSLRCMIGTSAIEEGFDAPVANVIIMAGCGRSERKTIQSTGRVLRPHDGKLCGIIHDFHDRCHPMLKRQSYSRSRIYKQLNYL